MSLLEDVLTLLQGAAVGTPGTDLYGAGWYDEGGAPDAQVAVFEYGSDPPSHVLGPTNEASSVHHRVQVVARSFDYLAARAKAQAAYDALANRVEITVGGRRYIRIEALQEPFDMGRDENNRRLVACNFRVTAEPA